MMKSLTNKPRYRTIEYVYLFGIVFLAAFIAVSLFNMGFGQYNALMIFMIGVLSVTSLTSGYRFGIMASFFSVIIFNFFFTEPIHTFVIDQANDFMLIFFFFIASIISSSLTARFRNQLVLSKKNEHTAGVLYEVAQRLLHVTSEEAIAQTGIALIKEYTSDDAEVIVQKSGQTYVGEQINTSKAESVSQLEISGLSQKIGTLRVHHQTEQLHKEQKWLSEAVAAQLGMALDRDTVYQEREQIQIAMERERTKSHLLRSISHDLRTPLTGIAGAGDYLRQRSQSLPTHTITKLATDIHEQAVWLTTLVENMLNMTRIENGKLIVEKRIEVIDDIINESIQHVPGLTKRSFSTKLPQQVTSAPMDGKLIVRVLVNLLSNAVMHTPESAPILLTVQQTEQDIVFSVEDGGPGIAPALKDHIFDAFTTHTKPGEDASQGIGLGLAICKSAVNAHGGTINFSQSSLGGASFTFNIPRLEANHDTKN